MPSVALRFRSILEPKLPGDKSKASSMGSLSSSLPLLLRYSSYCYYSTLSTSAYLAPSVVSCSLGPFLRRQFSNPMSRVRLYRHLCSLGISFDTYSCTSRTPLRRLTTLCTRHVAYPVPSHVGQSSRPDPKKFFVCPLGDLLLPPTNALMRSRKRKAPAATAESAPCSTSHWALPNDGNEEYTFKLFFRRRPPERRCCWYCNLLSLKLLTLFSESLL